MLGKTADALLCDLNGYDDLKRHIGEFCEELDDYHNDQFDSWSREMLQRIESEELRYYCMLNNLSIQVFFLFNNLIKNQLALGY